MGRKEGPIWNYFARFRKGANLHGKCNFCGQTYLSNASRMERHLAKYCPKVTKNIKKIFCDSKTNNKENIQDIDSNESNNMRQDVEIIDTDKSESSTRTQKSQQLRGFLDCMNKEDNNKLNILLARAIFATATPHLFVENPHVNRFIKYLRPSYKLPSRYVLSTTLLDKEYNLLQKLVQNKIRNCQSMALLSDGWTDINNISLINIVFTTPEPVFYRAIDSKTESHTGQYIATILGQAVEDVGPLKVGAIITDNARNMKSAWVILKNKYPHIVVYGCTAHSLNLLFKDILLLPTISRVASQVKDIIKFFRNKHAPRQVLKELQIASINKEIQLLTSSDTRWGSTSNSFESIIKNKDYLQNATFNKYVKPILENNMKKLILDEDYFWPKVIDIFNLIKPLADAIKKVETDTPVLSTLTNTIKQLEEHLQNSSDFLSASDQSKLLTCLNKRCTEFIMHPVQLAANLLNPQEMGKDLSEEDQNTALDFITDLAEKYSLNVENIISDLANYRAKSDVWIRERVWKSSNNISPVTWWLGFFPNRELTKIAIKILNFPATAASSERNWKAYSQVHTKKRNKLSIERAMKLVYVKFNLALFNNENIEELANELNEEEVVVTTPQLDLSQTEDDDSDFEKENVGYIVYDDHESEEDESENENNSDNDLPNFEQFQESEYEKVSSGIIDEPQEAEIEEIFLDEADQVPNQNCSEGSILYHKTIKEAGENLNGNEMPGTSSSFKNIVFLSTPGKVILLDRKYTDL